MAKEICISSTPHETRLAILEDDQLAEIYYERENEYTLAGSIYNGRVTRVLPGMQSAFVDVGLERDAFLYVTDFLELEDPEESDELEKASASGAATPPREVHRQASPEQDSGRNGRRNEGRNSQPAEQRQEARPQKAPGEPASSGIVIESDSDSEHEAGGDESGATGGKRWRGRRRRRGGRGLAGSDENRAGSGQAGEGAVEPVQESPAASQFQAASSERAESERTESRSEPWGESRPDRASFGSRGSREPRGGQTETPFVLPGESLRKNGATPEIEDPKPIQEAAPRPASNFKPASLVEGPFEWDGSGLLPGESISRHRQAQAEPKTQTRTEPAEPAQSSASPDGIEEQELVQERAEATEQEFQAAHLHSVSEEQHFDFEETEETSETSSTAGSADQVAHEDAVSHEEALHSEETPAQRAAHESAE